MLAIATLIVGWIALEAVSLWIFCRETRVAETEPEEEQLSMTGFRVGEHRFIVRYPASKEREALVCLHKSMHGVLEEVCNGK